MFSTGWVRFIVATVPLCNMAVFGIVNTTWVLSSVAITEIKCLSWAEPPPAFISVWLEP